MLFRNTYEYILRIRNQLFIPHHQVGWIMPGLIRTLLNLFHEYKII